MADDDVPTTGRRRRTWRATATASAAALVVAAVCMTWAQRTDDDGCDALGAHVDGISVFRSTNGITVLEAAWSSVLVDHTHVPASARDAVRTDDEGFARVLAALPDELRPDAERLHAALVRRSDPDVPDPATDEAAGALARHVIDVCNVAP